MLRTQLLRNFGLPEEASSIILLARGDKGGAAAEFGGFRHKDKTANDHEQYCELEQDNKTKQ